MSSDQRSPNTSSETLSGQPDRALVFRSPDTFDLTQIACDLQVNSRHAVAGCIIANYDPDTPRAPLLPTTHGRPCLDPGSGARAR